MITLSSRRSQQAHFSAKWATWLASPSNPLITTAGNSLTPTCSAMNTTRIVFILHLSSNQLLSVMNPVQDLSQEATRVTTQAINIMRWNPSVVINPWIIWPHDMCRSSQGSKKPSPYRLQNGKPIGMKLRNPWSVWRMNSLTLLATQQPTKTRFLKAWQMLRLHWLSRREIQVPSDQDILTPLLQAKS